MATAQKSAANAKQAPAATPAKKVTPVADKPKTLEAHQVVLSTVIQNAVGILSWSKFAGEADLQELCTDLDKRIDKINGGDMSSVEAMLFGQAKVLETMFTSLARRAANNDGLKQFQVNLTLALKAQAQCRSTLEALAEIKNPRPVQFVKQANMTTGPQQINNAAGTEQYAQAHTGARNIQSAPNKLLEADHGERMDIGAQGEAGRANSNLEAVGAVHRAKVG
jgi:hypothetical protein